MIFQTFGPFDIGLDKDGNVPDKLDDFWGKVEDKAPRLSSAKGCYLFGVKTSGSSSLCPWYIGRTLNSFNVECFQPHKRVIYAKTISKYERAKPHLLLIPRVTNGGAFYKGNSDKAISFLERHLISLGIRANSELQNKKDTKLYR